MSDGTLIARPCFIDIDVNGNACVMRGVDRGGCRTDIDGCQPARVAMGEDIDRLTGFLAARDRLDQWQTMAPDRRVDRHVFIGDFSRARDMRWQHGRNAATRSSAADHSVERPLQIDRRRSRRRQHVAEHCRRFSSDASSRMASATP